MVKTGPDTLYTLNVFDEKKITRTVQNISSNPKLHNMAPPMSYVMGTFEGDIHPRDP